MPTADLSPDLLLTNARVVTMSEDRPLAQAVAVQGDRIVWVGSCGDADDLKRRHTRVVDCHRQALLPGFIDAHCHLMAYASSLLAVDCAPSAVGSIEEINDVVRQRARATPTGQWIRGTGYDELSLLERRHPTRWDLDSAAPHHPVRLNHRSGHARVLNSVGLDRVAITAHTPDPADGVIERDETGEPTGLLLEMDDYLDGRIPRLTEAELTRGMQAVSRLLLSNGVTSVQDATHSNSVDRWNTLRALKVDGSLVPRVTLMAGLRHLIGFENEGLGFGSGDEGMSLGHVKIMLTATTGSLQPPLDDLRERIVSAHKKGFPVAIHAVERDAVDAATDALLQVRSGRSRNALRDRIEHCSECPPDAMRRLAASGIIVVTQPALLYERGGKYLSEVPAEVQPWLYRIKAFFDAGLRPAAGSDAPVTPPRPLAGMYAAVTRRAQTGETVGLDERIPALDALRMHTVNAAYAGSHEADRGSIEVGKLADLALLDRDPLGVDAESIRDIAVTMTVAGGQVAWEA
ncbi:MAG: amidohydrolase [Chloroflexi bacterium]|nr:amidohydrolase [Chloroflexota bacterium]